MSAPAWKVAEGYQCVECPACGFLMWEGHTDEPDGGYTCPDCGPSIDVSKTTRAKLGMLRRKKGERVTAGELVRRAIDIALSRPLEERTGWRVRPPPPKVLERGLRYGCGHRVKAIKNEDRDESEEETSRRGSDFWLTFPTQCPAPECKKNGVSADLDIATVRMLSGEVISAKSPRLHHTMRKGGPS